MNLLFPLRGSKEVCKENATFYVFHYMYRVTLVVADLGWVDLNFDIPLSSKFQGSWEFGRTGRVIRQDDGTY